MTTHGGSEYITLGSGVRRYAGIVRTRERVKLQVRAWVNRSATHGWITFLDSDPFLAHMATQYPRLISKRAYSGLTLAMSNIPLLM